MSDGAKPSAAAPAASARFAFAVFASANKSLTWHYCPALPAIAPAGCDLEIVVAKGTAADPARLRQQGEFRPQGSRRDPWDRLFGIERGCQPSPEVGRSPHCFCRRGERHTRPVHAQGAGVLGSIRRGVQHGHDMME